MPVAENVCILGCRDFYRTPIGNIILEFVAVVAGAASEALARWLHHRYVPVEVPSAGQYIVSPRDTLFTVSCYWSTPYWTMASLLAYLVTF